MKSRPISKIATMPRTCSLHLKHSDVELVGKYQVHEGNTAHATSPCMHKEAKSVARSHDMQVQCGFQLGVMLIEAVDWHVLAVHMHFRQFKHINCDKCVSVLDVKSCRGGWQVILGQYNRSCWACYTDLGGNLEIIKSCTDGNYCSEITLHHSYLF